MKILVTIIILQLTLTVYGQYISPEDIFKVNDLYIGEQYGAFADKLKNLGFKPTESVQDYTLNNINYKSECSFEMKTNAPWHKGLSALGNSENYNTSSWGFKIEEHKIYRTVKIRFLIYAINSKQLFTSLCFKWINKDKAIEMPYSTEFDKKLIVKAENFGFDLENGGVYELPDKLDAQVEFHDNIINGQEYGAYIRVFLEYTFANHPLTQPIEEYLKEQEEKKGQSIISVPIKNEGKISKVNIVVGGKAITYIIDSGASDMNINESIEKYLKEIGALRSSDYLTPAKYQLADGSIKEYRRVLLNSVKIGNVTIDLVTANITGDNEVLLLGKSFLNQFSYWKINNETKTLELRRK